MTPQKWITIKHSNSPQRTLQCSGQNVIVDFEDIYAKIWLPLILKDKFKLAIAPSYRTEQIELHSTTNSELNKLSHWNLRSAGLDSKIIYRLNDQRTLVVGTNLSRSATTESLRLNNLPVNYTISAVYMNRISLDKEMGFGLLHSSIMSGIPVLPIFIWNQTINKRNGIEVSLPSKVAWRHNLSPRNILHFKAEGVTRSYYVDQVDKMQFRRTDLDIGVSYTRLLNKWTGIELFSGFRQNLSSHLPDETILKTSSGFAASVELFIIPAFMARKSNK
jgi:hypothetical protein